MKLLEELSRKEPYRNQGYRWLKDRKVYEYVKEHYDEITEARVSGYSWPQISEAVIKMCPEAVTTARGLVNTYYWRIKKEREEKDG